MIEADNDSSRHETMLETDYVSGRHETMLAAEIRQCVVTGLSVMVPDMAEWQIKPSMWQKVTLTETQDHWDGTQTDSLAFPL